MRIFSSIALVAGVGITAASGLACSLCVDSARAADCLAAPNARAPSGQHWYYHFDRVNRRRCWYLHSPMPLAQRPIAAHHAGAVSSDPAPAEVEAQPDPAASSISAAAPRSWANPPASAPPAPQITILTVRPVNLPSVTAAPTRRSDPSQATASAPPSMPRASGQEVTAGAPPSIPRVPGQEQFVEQDAGTRPVTFVLLVFGLGIIAVFLAIIVRGAARAREPIVSLHPDDAWRRRGLLLRQLAEPEAVDTEDALADPPLQQEPSRQRQRRQVGPASPAQMTRNPAAQARNAPPASDRIAAGRSRSGYSSATKSSSDYGFDSCDQAPTMRGRKTMDTLATQPSRKRSATVSIDASASLEMPARR